MKKICNIAPSILSADFAFLYAECKKMVDMGCDSLHIDIMDGHFVPNLSFGPPVVKCLRKHLPNIFFDCHIMVSDPENYVQSLYRSGANGITFHYQASYKNLNDLCNSIRQRKMKVGISIKPNTKINEQIRTLIKNKAIDMILIMTVEPGFGGQKFMSDMMSKVKEVRDQFSEIDIQVDGGIGQQNITIVAQNGANCIVSGTGIFGSNNPQQTMKKMKAQVNKYIK